MPSGESILGLSLYVIVILIFFGMLWLTNPKHDERLEKFVGWLWEKNHGKSKKPKKY